MSGNIKDTNVELIKTQTFNLINDLENYSKSSRNISVYEKALQKKYEHLFTTSKTLFNMVFNSFKNKNFDKNHFNEMINKMLEYITQIQNNKISQHDASVNVGTDLACKYIPQLKDKKEELEKIIEIKEEDSKNN